MKKLLLIFATVIFTASTACAQQSALNVIQLPLGDDCIQDPCAVTVNHKEDVIFTASMVSGIEEPFFTHDAILQKYDVVSGNLLVEKRYSEFNYAVKPVDIIMYEEDRVVVTATLFQAFSNNDALTVMLLDSNLNAIEYYPLLVPANKRIEVSSRASIFGNTLSFVATITDTTWMMEAGFANVQIFLLRCNLATGQFTQTELVNNKVCAGVITDESSMYMVLRNADLTNTHVAKFDLQSGNQVWVSANLPMGNVQGFGFSADGLLYLAHSNHLFEINPLYGAINPIPGTTPFIVSAIQNGFLLGPAYQSESNHNLGEKIICSPINASDSTTVVADFTDSNPLTTATLGGVYVGENYIFWVGAVSNVWSHPQTMNGFLGWIHKDDIYSSDGGIVTGINSSNPSGIVLSPNPTFDGNITVTTKSKTGFLTVTDIVGKIILTKEVTEKETELHLSSKGVHFLKTDEGTVSFVVN